MSDKTIRMLYGVALLLFIGGAADVSMFIMQRHDDFQKGLSDELALTGLGVWWVPATPRWASAGTCRPSSASASGNAQ